MEERHVRAAGRLPRLPGERARLRAGGREAARAGGAAPRDLDAHGAHRAQPHPLAPDLARDLRARDRRDLADLVHVRRPRPRPRPVRDDRRRRGCTRATSRSGGLAEDVPPGFTAEARKFCDAFPRSVDEYEAILDGNAIWLERTKGIGLLSAEDALALGQSGPMLRASGRRLGPAQAHALPRLRRGRVRRAGLRERRRLRPLQGPHGRDARVRAHRPPVPRQDRRDRRASRGSPTTARSSSRRGTSSTPRWSR